MTFSKFCEQIGMKKDVLSFYESFYAKTVAKGVYAELDAKAKNIVFAPSKNKYEDFLNDICEEAKRNSLDKFSLFGLFVLSCFIHLERVYEKHVLPHDVFLDSASDVLVKIDECKKVYGVYGTFVPSWFYGFLSLRTFRLGRLEFEQAASSHAYNRNGISIKRGDPILNTHIPSGAPLDYSEVRESFKKAYYFFKYERVKAFRISSWLALKDLGDVFPQQSNLKAFHDLWDNIDNHYEEGFHDCWRIFGRDYDGDPKKLEAKTSLQRNIINYLNNGGKMGEGIGFLLFDGNDFA